MSFARQQLTRLAAERNRPASDVDRYAKALEDNWYDTKEALAQCNASSLEALGLPKFLAEKLIESAGASPASSAQPLPAQPKFTLNLPANPRQNAPAEQLKPLTITQQPKQKKEQSLFEEKMNIIGREYFTDAEKRSSLELLQTIFRNILSSPDNDKFRTLSLSNEKLFLNIWKFRDVKELFPLLGFEYRQAENVFFLPKSQINSPALNEILVLIDEELKKTPISDFDPFKANYTSNTPKFSIETLSQIAGGEIPDFTAELDKLYRQRDQILNQTNFKPTMRIFHRSQIEATPVPDLEITQADELAIFKKNIIEFHNKFSKEITFQNAKKIEFEKLRKTPVDPIAEIRVVLPNEWIIELRVAAKERLGLLFELISARLAVPGRYYLYTPPIVKQKLWSDDVKAHQQSLMMHGFVPNAQVCLKFENENLNFAKDLIRA